MKALRFSRHEGRYAAAMLVSKFVAGAGAAVGPLSLINDDGPELPTSDWIRVWPRLAGICGSDLATIDGQTSRYFEDFVSFPFIPGHEVVADTEDGRRVVLEPVLGHASRGLSCPSRELRPPTATTTGTSPAAISHRACKPDSAKAPAGLVHRVCSPSEASFTKCPTG